MTKQHFQAMADIVKAILAGKWTNEPPSWSNDHKIPIIWETPDPYQRAVQTAEVFIVLCERWNPRFDHQRFLVACGLSEPVSRKRCKLAE